MAERASTVGAADADPSDGRDESVNERMDRNWNEILQELRVTQTGTQILTGFLLAIAFQSKFDDLTTFQLRVYLVLVITAVLTTAMGLAPVNLHRGLFRKHAKPVVVRTAHIILRITLVGVGLVLTGTVLLIFDVVLGHRDAFIAAGFTLLVVIVIAALPLILRMTSPRDQLSILSDQTPRKEEIMNSPESSADSAALADPTKLYHTGDFPQQQQDQPGLTTKTEPRPDHGEQTYVGSGRLTGRKALITGGDSGIGRAVAIAFAREGADVAISYLPEEEVDAQDTAEFIREADRTALLLPGDARDESYCEELVSKTVDGLGGLDIVVLNAAYQENREGLENLPTEEFDRVFKTNLYGLIWVARAAIPHLKPGSSIITTASIQAFDPSPNLIDYAMTKAAQVAFTKALAQDLGERGIRVNAVAPGPIWTPLIPATSWSKKLLTFGQDTPLGRAGQPAELAPAYVFLASAESSYVSGAVLPVTGGRGL